MGEVVQLQKEPKAGDQMFALCGCTEEGVPMNVVTIMAETPFIAALVCPECDTEVPVSNGYIGFGEG
ncbi:hypothetical protein [Halomonas elongata]|uniref:hypothetical protein n=1 Tax=Halomonas elongata TaxID=2746 RepID=UPI00186B922A|nr:hypothetical protein [Halomonas elongata]MBW5801177.1 hypothetical protein [Halomonas elongata]